MSKENSQGEQEDSESSSKHSESLDRSEEEGDEKRNELDRDFDARALTAILTIKDDFDRQLESVLDRQNTMIQSIGIILAFASVLLVSVMRSVQLRLDSVPEVISVAALFSCCVIGIVTIREWKNWELYSGLDLGKVIDAFNEEQYTRLYYLLLGGTVRSYETMSGKNFILRDRITYMVLSLLMGTVFALVGMVIEWV